MMMNPYQSWTTLLVLFALIAAVIWLLVEIRKDLARRNTAAEGEPQSAARGPLAIVTDMRTRRRISHLTLVQDPPQRPKLALYDWQTHGI